MDSPEAQEIISTLCSRDMPSPYLKKQQWLLVLRPNKPAWFHTLSQLVPVKKNAYKPEKVHVKIQQAIRPKEDLLTIIKRRKLQWYVLVSHSSSLSKTILQGTVKGGKRQGRQRKRWKDNIREWTGLEFAKSQMAMENRGKWRKLVAKSSVYPNDSRG